MTLAVPATHSFLTTDGQNLDLFPVLSEWTVAQAAVFLDMSEDCLNQLLDFGVLEYKDDNGCRLIRRDDLFEHERERKRRRAALDELVRLDQEMGLYDD